VHFGFLPVTFLLWAVAEAADPSPRIVYGTYLGGRHKECATAIAVDRMGSAYVAGRTPSPDFPVTAGAFRNTARVNNDDWTGFVSKISEHGDRLLYSTLLGASFRTSVNTIAVDSTARASVGGSTCSSDFPVTRLALFRTPQGSDKTDLCDGFVATLNAEGSRLEYGTYLGGSREDTVSTVVLSPGEDVIYAGGHTASPDFAVTEKAPQPKLEGLSNGFFSAIDAGSGKLIYSTYLGGTGHDWVTGSAIAPSGAVYVCGVTESINWPSIPLMRLGRQGGTDGFVMRLDPAGKQRPLGIRIGGSGNERQTGIAVDSRGDIYAAGSTDSTDFPVAGANSGATGGAFVVKMDGRRFAHPNGVIWSRRLGGHGDDELLSVSAGMSGSIFVCGRSGSKDFAVTKNAIYRRLEADNDSILMRLRASDGRVEFATFVGGTRKPHASWYNDEATGIAANATGDVYVTGCTLDDRLPVTPTAFQPRPKGNSERLCSG
jgi:hypothetical protein